MKTNPTKWLQKAFSPLKITGVAVLLVVLWQVHGNMNAEKDKQLRRQVRQKIVKTFPEEAKLFSQNIGLFSYGAVPERPVSLDLNRPSVVLVHGLDDPGKVWMNLAPALVTQGYNVWLLNYPNDQPVTESSQLFAEELQGLRKRGVTNVDIVAHSMGGLISRDLLTSPSIQYKKLQAEDRVPKNNTLIMVGTPNHGSQVARFHLLGEIRDHLVRLMNGGTSWLDAFFDGAGEAQIDLLPDSVFLTELNQRPHPKEVDTLIIAGVSSPWNKDDITQMKDNIKKMVPKFGQEVDMMGEYMQSMINGLGDGLVTVDSTRLQGIPYITVKGTHLSMIRNISTESQRVPPAIPVIIKKLAEPK
jgi:hypothetical protein